MSAVEVVGKSENLKDLLGEQGNGSMCSSGGASPSLYLPRERASSIQVLISLFIVHMMLSMKVNLISTKIREFRKWIFDID